jgi:plastocyanin
MKKVLIGVFILTLVFAQFIVGQPALAAATNNTTGTKHTQPTNSVNRTDSTAKFRTTNNATTLKPAVTSNQGAIRGIVKAVSADSITIGTTNVTVVPETRYNVPGIKNATLSDIKVGMNVIAQTVKINNHAYASLLNVVPITRHFVGEVTAYNYDVTTGGNITIKDKNGKTYSFEIVAGEFTVQPQGAVVKVGEQVTVTTRQAKNEEKPVAIGVMVSTPLEHYSGNVTVFNYNPATGGNISIVEKGGATLTFDILANKFSVQPKGAIVKVGLHVTVIVQTPPGGSKPVAISVEVIIPAQHFAGKITEFSYDPAKGGKISILEKDGKKLNFDIEAGKFTVQPKDASVKVGDNVTVVAKALAEGHLVAIGVVIQPQQQSVKGIINNIDQVSKTITIGTTVVRYNAKTLFRLHGMLAVSQGLQANATCVEQPDHTILAVSISVEPPIVSNPQ